MLSVSSIAWPVVFTATLNDPLNVRSGTPTNDAVPVPSNAYVLDPLVGVSITTPNLALSTWTPVKPDPAKAVIFDPAAVIFPVVFENANVPLSEAKS